MDDENLDYEKLLDTELIERFCADTPDHDAFTTLWKRYEQTAQKYAKHFTIMCPHFHSKDLFAEEVFSRTQEKVVRKIGQFRAAARFSTWLYRIAEHTAIELRRKLQGRSRAGPYNQVSVTDAELSGDSGMVRDKRKHDPFHAASTREFNALVNSVLDNYKSSKEGRESFDVVRLFAIEDRTVPEIAASRGTYEKKIYRILGHDYESLKASFTDAGVRALLER